MKILPLSTNSNSIKFKSGLTGDFLKTVENIDVKRVEQDFNDDYNIDANFGGDKMYAAYCALTLNIFEKLSEKYHLPFFSLPPRIRAYKANNLIGENQNNFCITDTKKVLKSELPFELRSIFFLSKNNVLKQNELIDEQYANNYRSSSHFLSDVIHEWIHNIHLDLIYKKYGYEGTCPFAKAQYNKVANTPCGLEKIKEYNAIDVGENYSAIVGTIGEYAATSKSKMEIFAELLTKLVTSTLDEKTFSPQKNPLNNVNKLPFVLRNIIYEEI